MVFRWEVHNGDKLVNLKDVELAGLKKTFSTDLSILRKHCRVPHFEDGRETSAHYTHTVDRINQRVGARKKDVVLGRTLIDGHNNPRWLGGIT